MRWKSPFPAGAARPWMLAAVAPAVAAAGCGTVVEPRPVETRPPIPVTGPGSAKLHFRGVRLDMQPSDVVALDRGGALLPGLPSACHGLGGELTLIDAQQPAGGGILLDDWEAELRDRLEPAGYDIVGDNRSFFQDRYEALEARYNLGGVVTEMAVIACPRRLTPRVTLLRGLFLTAEASVTVRWEVMDDIDRRIVLRTTSRGYARLTDHNRRIGARALRRAFGSAAANLAADPAFWRLVTARAAPPPRLIARRSGSPPPAPAASVDGTPAGASSGGAAGDGTPRRIAGPPPRSGAAAADLAPFTRSTAVVYNGDGHGSAFLIDPAGLLLTNAHVGGLGGQVGVRFVDGPRRVATVLAADARRDVALLSVDPVPDRAPLPIRHAPVRVGEAVAAIGAPRSDYLSGTVSRGTVSALRHFRFPAMGDQPYIQADAAIIGGNSGGPLIDARGNVVGLSVAGIVDAEGGDTHLNLFIPIGEALAALDLVPPRHEPGAP